MAGMPPPPPDRQLGVPQFPGLPSHERPGELRDRGRSGCRPAAQINWSLPLVPLRSGPYGLWLMRQTPNLLLELGRIRFRWPPTFRPA